VPFVVLISALLLGGVLGLLFFNTSMQQASFRETALSHQARDLNAQQEALQLQLDKLRDPQRIAAEAQRMGMVIPTGPSGVLNYGTGRISGSPVPAQGQGLPLGQPPARKPAGFTPPVIQQKAPATTTKATTTKATTTNPTTTQTTTRTGTRANAGSTGASTGNR
jgi:outer membrane murein-binding lipoprotein Lpp